MKNETYTVKHVAKFANVTVKTLHHYDAIGLLRPLMVASSGYRLYGLAQLERLQEILFYRELGIPLKDIKLLLTRNTNRLDVLSRQRDLLRQKQVKTDRLIATIERTIGGAQKGNTVTAQDLFDGFQSEAEWNTALSTHNAHLLKTYDIQPPSSPIDVGEMNEMAKGAIAFNTAMIEALKNRVKHDDPTIQTLISGHITFQCQHGHPSTAESFAAQTKFFLTDDFHHDMLENWQPGLSYYLYAAANAYAD